MPRPNAHAPNKQGGKPAGQDTSSYMHNNSKHLNVNSCMVGVEPLRLSLVNFKKIGFTAAKMYIDNHLKYYRTEKGKREIFKLFAVRVQ